MSITDLTVGTASTGNNAAVTPGAPSGLTAGDLAIIFAAIRNSPAGTPATPSGWTRVTAAGASAALFGKVWQTGDAWPSSITFTGGVANADTYARGLKARGAALDTLTENTATFQLNSSAQNIAYPAYNLPGPNHLLVMALWKQDDATSLATPAGWTSQGLTSTTTGDDQLAQIYTQLQTTEADISSGSVVVTGGVAAISSAQIFAIRPAPTLSVLEFELFPPRTLVTITGLTPGDDVKIYRVVDGERVLLRGGELDLASDPSFLVVDGELPFGVPVSYVAVVNSVAEYSSAQVTYSLSGGKPILTDAITGDGSEFVIVAWDEKNYDRQASVFKVGGRNVVVTGDLGQFEATLEIFFEAYSSTENFKALISTATQGVLQLRRPDPKYDGVNCYVSVLQAREKRFSQDGSDERRTWVLEVAETDEWAGALAASAFNLQDVADFYSGLTLADLAGDYATLLQMAQGDFS